MIIEGGPSGFEGSRRQQHLIGGKARPGLHSSMSEPIAMLVEKVSPVVIGSNASNDPLTSELISYIFYVKKTKATNFFPRKRADFVRNLAYFFISPQEIS